MLWVVRVTWNDNDGFDAEFPVNREYVFHGKDAAEAAAKAVVEVYDAECAYVTEGD